jgi:hypothetical protein
MNRIAIAIVVAASVQGVLIAVSWMYQNPFEYPVMSGFAETDGGTMAFSVTVTATPLSDRVSARHWPARSQGTSKFFLSPNVVAPAWMTSYTDFRHPPKSFQYRKRELVAQAWGWPLRCVSFCVQRIDDRGWDIYEKSGVMTGFTAWQALSTLEMRARIVPLHVHVMALLTNISLMVAALLFATLVIRLCHQRFRMANSRCARCGYPLDTFDRPCPECGWRLVRGRPSGLAPSPGHKEIETDV